MDDYQEYARMAKLMTKIHATQSKKAQTEKELDENDNAFSNDNCEQKMEDEEVKEETHTNSVKFHFRNISNLDTSMEEEKDVTQNFGKVCKPYENKQSNSWNNAQGLDCSAEFDSDNEEQDQNK